MAIAARQRIFNAIFPPEESPFLSGAGKLETLPGEQQRLWDVVTRALKPTFTLPPLEQGIINNGTPVKYGR